ncbi:hypothetical protein NQZ79_g1784 [Umbelopsis isabellina]|nr:hypothetical protein NQZ79_g1784 [Umbelopsis isabellina]
MQPNTLVGKDFVANIELSSAPNRPPNAYTLVLIAGEPIQDHVINFMKKEHIPAYLESSILSTVNTLYEKYRNDTREAACLAESLFEIQNLKQSRLAFINSYEQHTLEYHSKNAKDTFAKAYYSLVHSPIPAIFDTILELEQNYALSIMQLIQARDNEIRSIKERHEREMEESYAGSQPTYLITQQVEELEVCQATWASDIHETQITQKREYRDFIAQLYQEYQNRLAQSAQDTSSCTINGSSKTTDTVDGKEIVSAAINKMKTSKQANSEQDHQSVQSDTSPEQVVDATTSPQSSSRRGSSTSLLTSPERSDVQEDRDQSSSQNLSIPDPNLQRMVKNIEEMGFPKEEAECALGMTNCNVQQAIMLLLERPDKVKAALASAESTSHRPSPGKVNMKRMSANIPNRSSSQALFGSEPGSGSPQRQSNRQRAITNPGSITDALNKNGRSWSPITFLQQQKQAMENTNVSSVRKLGGWLGKAMENLGLDDNGSPYPTSPGQMHTSQLVESFTITLGTAHARATHNLRLLVTDEATEIFCPDINDTGRELAYRAQNANNLYSNQLSAMVCLVDINEVPIEHSSTTDQSYHRGWTRYRNGQGSNQALFTRCHQSTEFHFPDIDSQLQEIEKDYIQNHRAVEEGDFFITRHSNLPLTQIVFHLVIDGDAISRVELSSQHPILSGLRNILRLTTRYEIGSLSLPLLSLPNYFLEQPEQYLFSSLSGHKASQTWLYKRGELVMKCVKGFLIESSRLGKAGPIERCFNFLLPKSTQIFSTQSGVNESSADVRGSQSQPDLEVAFQQFRRMLVEMFRAT